MKKKVFFAKQRYEDDFNNNKYRIGERSIPFSVDDYVFVGETGSDRIKLCVAKKFITTGEEDESEVVFDEVCQFKMQRSKFAALDIFMFSTASQNQITKQTRSGPFTELEIVPGKESEFEVIVKDGENFLNYIDEESHFRHVKVVADEKDFDNVTNQIEVYEDGEGKWHLNPNTGFYDREFLDQFTGALSGKGGVAGPAEKFLKGESTKEPSTPGFYDCFVPSSQKTSADENDSNQPTDESRENSETEEKTPKMPESKQLLRAYNIILHGAPGTGKTYLAKQIAADIVSGGRVSAFEDLSEEERDQVGFVQFHPGYDYSDFVEGLRPVISANGEMAFELKDGTFKAFVEKAVKNYDSLPDGETGRRIKNSEQAIEDFLTKTDFEKELETSRKAKYIVEKVDENYIYIFIKSAPTRNRYKISKKDICKLLEYEGTIKNLKEMNEKFNLYHDQRRSYEFDLYKRIKKHMKDKGDVSEKIQAQHINKKKYVFIIDEINRGNISQIFGELFFSIDPGYRGEEGSVSTQYTNMHDDLDEKFYIPENVYIIGTMNDIDRSVDSFDFAMRRRFRFIEVEANEHVGMLDSLQDRYDVSDIKNRMVSLNKEIEKTDGLRRHYQIGPAYFLKLKEIEEDKPFDILWNDYLEPLLQDYVQGFDEVGEIIKKFKTAYDKINTDNKTAEAEDSEVSDDSES